MTGRKPLSQIIPKNQNTMTNRQSKQEHQRFFANSSGLIISLAEEGEFDSIWNLEQKIQRIQIEINSVCQKNALLEEEIFRLSSIEEQLRIEEQKVF
jgi:hypothetical protein